MVEMSQNMYRVRGERGRTPKKWQPWKTDMKRRVCKEGPNEMSKDKERKWGEWCHRNQVASVSVRTEWSAVLNSAQGWSKRGLWWPWWEMFQWPRG